MFFCRVVLASAMALPLAAHSQVSSPDVSMIVTGTLGNSSDGKVIPGEGDTLTLVNASTAVTEASVTVGSSGSYAAILSKPSTFNGTRLTFRPSHGSSVYKMLYSGGGEATFVFNGALLPSQTTLNLIASSVVVSSTTPTGPRQPIRPPRPPQLIQPPVLWVTSTATNWSTTRTSPCLRMPFQGGLRWS